MSVAPSAASRSGRTGLFALAHRRSTLVGVSSPWSVVRSIHVIARSSHAACHSFLTVRRVGIVAARRSTALRLMRSARTRSRSRGTPGLRSGWVNTRSARSGKTAAGAAPAAGVGCSYRRLVSMADSNLRRVFLLRRVPLGFALLRGSLLGGCPSLRLLASRLGSRRCRGLDGGGGGSLRRSGTGRGRFSLLLGLVRYRPPVLLEPVGALSLRRGRGSGGGGGRGGGAAPAPPPPPRGPWGRAPGGVALRGRAGGRGRAARS